MLRSSSSSFQHESAGKPGKTVRVRKVGLETPGKPPLAWIIDAAEKLQYHREESMRHTAANWFRNVAPKIVDSAQYFAGTLVLALSGDTNNNVRRLAAETLGLLGSEAIPYQHVLEKALLNDRDEKVREVAAKALGLIGKEDREFSHAEAFRQAALYDCQQEVRKVAAVGLAAVDTEGAIKEIGALSAEVTTGDDPVLRCRAAAALALAGPKAVPHAEALATSALNDTAAGVRLAAVAAIRASPEVTKAALPHLVAGLEHADPGRRKAAARALGEIDPNRILEPEQEDVTQEDAFRQTLTRSKKKTPSAPTSARSATTELSTVPELAAEQEAQPTRLKRSKAPKASAKKGKKAKAATPKAAAAPTRPETAAHVRVHRTAGQTLANLALYDEDAMVRFRAGEAMSTFGNTVTQHVNLIAQKSLKDDDAEARARASEALGMMGAQRDVAAQTFSEVILKSPRRPGRRRGIDPEVQRRAVDALRDLGTAAQPHRPTLDAAKTSSRDEGVRMAASRTLGFLERQRMGATGRTLVGTGPLGADVAELLNSTASLRFDAAAASVEARCSTPAKHRSEGMLFLQAKLLA